MDVNFNIFDFIMINWVLGYTYASYDNYTIRIYTYIEAHSHLNFLQDFLNSHYSSNSMSYNCKYNLWKAYFYNLLFFCFFIYNITPNISIIFKCRSFVNDWSFEITLVKIYDFSLVFFKINIFQNWSSNIFVFFINSLSIVNENVMLVLMWYK